MWPWKKRKPNATEETTDRQVLPLTRTMGIVAPPTTPRKDKPGENPEEKPRDPLEGIVESGIIAPDDWKRHREKKDEDEGTSSASASVSGGMEPTNTPLSNRFDPSKANASTLIPLQSIQIAKPCRANWDKMQGDDKSRFCQSCQKSVYNLSAMTTADAESLLAEKGGDLCARIYRRADGTVITGDCPVGKREARRPFWGLGAGFAALLGLGAVFGGGASSATVMVPEPAYAPTPTSWSEKIRAVPVVGAVINMISPSSPPFVAEAGGIGMGSAQPAMGDIASPVADKTPCPAPTAAPTSAPVPPVMGRIACPPTPKPKPTAAPEMGEPTMGAPAIPKQP